MHTNKLKSLPVLLSASVPDELKGSPRALDLLNAITLLVRRILATGGQVVFGGHPSIVPLVHQAARDVGIQGGVRLYLLRRFRDQVPKEVEDHQVFGEVNWIGSEDPTVPIQEDLAQLRTAMIAASRAAIFIGGKTGGFLGDRPGIRDEYQRFLHQHQQGPVYLLGMLDGETGRIIEELDVKGEQEQNRLNDESIRFIHNSDNADLIAPLVVADLERASVPRGHECQSRV